MAQLPFHPEQLSAEDKQIYDHLVEKRKQRGAPFAGPYSALMNHPQLCEKIEALGGYLKFNGQLPRDVYQFVVLAVASYTRSAFEWIDHVDHALTAGVPQPVIDTLKTTGLASPDFPPPYQLAARVITACLAWKNIPDNIQQQAIEQFGVHGFVEVVVLSGFYQMFSTINQGFDVQPPREAILPW